MTAVYLTKAELQAIPIDRTRLHFVAENLSWYYGDPGSSATADGENTLTPTTGGGRYLKQSSRSVQNAIVWNAVSTAGSFTAVAGNGYIFDFAAIGGDLTVPLPSSPAIGQQVRFIYASATNIQRRLIISPGSSSINGVTSNIFAYQEDHSITLEWLGASMGWLYSSNRDLAPSPVGTLNSFTAPATVNLAQNGIINFMGRRFNLSNSYVTPFGSALANNFYLFYSCADGIVSGLFANLGDRTITGVDLYSLLGTGRAGPNEAAFLLPMNVANFSQQYPIRLSSIYFQGTNLATSNISLITIQGTNDFTEASSITWRKPSSLYGLYLSRANRDLNGITNSVNWETIAQISPASLTVGNGNFGAGTNNAQFLPVNSGKFYTAYRIVFLYQTTGTSITIQELELYGDIITP